MDDAPFSVLRPPIRLQRATGEGRVAVKSQGGVTCLDRLFQDGCGKIRLPREDRDSGLTAVLINSSGGVTGGDSLAWRAESGAGARLTVTTQACEKLYRAASGEPPARIEARLMVSAGARLDWLPQESILFDGASAERRLEADWVRARAQRNGMISTLVEQRKRANEPLGRIRVLSKSLALLAAAPLRSLVRLGQAQSMSIASYPLHVAIGRVMGELGMFHEQYRQPEKN